MDDQNSKNEFEYPSPTKAVFALMGRVVAIILIICFSISTAFNLYILINGFLQQNGYPAGFGITPIIVVPNDDPEADAMAARVLNLFWNEIAKYPSGRGGVYTGACSLLTSGIAYGQVLGAFPDGRFAGEPLGNSMGPRPGADKNGLTAMLNSVAKLPMEKGVGGTTLNVILTSRMLETPTLRASVSATIKSFLMHGGCMAQFTTACKEDLLDAKCHPDRHGDLSVRVGGYSIQFVQLDSAAQDEIISRYV